MKIITKAKNFSLNESQKQFIDEKIVKIRELSKNLNDESHEIHIDFEVNETQKPEDKYSCVATANLKWHSTIRVEKKSDSVEKAFMEMKKVLVEDIKKLKNKKWWIFWKIKNIFWK